MSTIGNNGSNKSAFVRDTFFDSAEQQYLEELMKHRSEREIHQKLLLEHAEKLYKKACNLIARVELGEFNEEEMEGVEKIIVHCLAAIEDFELANERIITTNKSTNNPPSESDEREL